MKLLMLSWIALGVGVSAFADPQCESRIAATGMLTMKGDEKVACEQNPSPVAQECMVELLTKGKGKMRNQDFVEVVGLCLVDPSPEVRRCVDEKLNKPWNDAGYRGVKVIGDECMHARRSSVVKYSGKPLKPMTHNFGKVSGVSGVREGEPTPGKVPAPKTQAAPQPHN